MDLEYITANASDVELIYRIKCKSIKTYVTQIWGWDESVQKEIHQKTYNASSINLIAYQAKICGFMDIKEHVNGLYIENLLIQKNHQNLGIGRQIMMDLINRSQQTSKPIHLQVFKINNKAQTFYEQFGFEIESETTHHFLMKRDIKYNILKRNL